MLATEGWRDLINQMYQNKVLSTSGCYELRLEQSGFLMWTFQHLKKHSFIHFTIYHIVCLLGNFVGPAPRPPFPHCRMEIMGLLLAAKKACRAHIIWNERRRSVTMLECRLFSMRWQFVLPPIVETLHYLP